MVEDIDKVIYDEFKSLDNNSALMAGSALVGLVSLGIYAIGRYSIGDDSLFGETLKYLGIIGTAISFSTAGVFGHRFNKNIDETGRLLEEKLAKTREIQRNTK